MHDLLAIVLNKKDLSKAGDLFSLEDKEIEKDLTEVLIKVRQVVVNQDYLQNDNDQSVIEICTTRVTSAIRENRSIESHAEAMVALLETCLHFNLKPTFRDEDPPHAKIASEILSCIFMNYTKKSVMDLGLPVAVQFLGRGNKELGRNMTSYLSLAAIDNAQTLAANIKPVIDSVVNGNTSLVRVLPQVYKLNRVPIDRQVGRLVSLLPECDQSEKSSLMQLFGYVAVSQPHLLEPHISQLCNYLSNPVTSAVILQVFVDMAATNPVPFASHVTSLKHTVEQQPAMLPLASKIMGFVGAQCPTASDDCLTILVQQLPNTDASTLPLVLCEIYNISLHNPSLLPEHLPSIVKFQQVACASGRMTIHQLKELCSNKHGYGSRGSLSPDKRTAWSQTEGVTVITVGNPSSYPSRSLAQMLGTSSSHLLSSNLPLSKNASTSTREISYPPIHYSANGLVGSNGLMSSGTFMGISGSQHNSGLVNMNGERGLMSSSLSNDPSLRNNASIHTLKSSHHTLPNPRSSQQKLQSSQQTLKSSQQTLRSSQITLPSNSHQVLPTSSHQTLPTIPQSSIIGTHALSSVPQAPPTYPSSLVNSYTSQLSSSHNMSVSSSLSHKMMSSSHHSHHLHYPSISQAHGASLHQAPPPITYQHHMAAHHTLPSHPAQNTQSNQHPNAQPQLMSQSYQPQSLSVMHNPHVQKSQTLPQPLHSSHPSHPATTASATLGGHVSPAYMTSQASQPRSRPTSGNHNPPTITNTYTGQPIHAIPHRDAVQQFCEKHLDKIKNYIENAKARLPIPIKATLQEVKQKHYCMLNFICSGQEDNCLYSKKFFTMRTKNARVWLHLMFLAIQAQSDQAVSQQDPSVGNLKVLWDSYKSYSGNGFVHLVTSSFPSTKDQETVLHELFNNRYFDVFDFNAALNHWACFMCNHPEKVSSLMQDGNPAIQGQLKEKKGRWKFLKRWKTRYFTLSGSAITYNKKDMRKETLPISKVQSVKAVRKGMRDIPKAFELFTNDQSYIFKVENGDNAEQWVQCLQIAVARSQKDDVSDLESVHAWNRRISSDNSSHKELKMDSQRSHQDYSIFDQTKL